MNRRKSRLLFALVSSAAFQLCCAGDTAVADDDFLSIAFNPLGVAVEKLGRAAGVPPPPTSILHSPVTLVREGPRIMEMELKTHVDLMSAHGLLLHAAVTGNPTEASQAFVLGARSRLEHALHLGAQVALEAHTSDFVPPVIREVSLEAPKKTRCNPGGFEGEPVLYVNGMLTTEEEAKTEANALSTRIRRPVDLIYNPRGSDVADAAEAFYDRSWPLAPIPTRVIQANVTTRQIAHEICHAEKPLAVCSYSQGGILVQNALMMAREYTGGRANQRVTWLAAGFPLRDEEIFAKPRKFRVLANPRDLVSQSIGLRLDPSDFTQQNADSAHSFVDSYVNQIESKDFD